MSALDAADFEPVGFDDLPGWADDRLVSAFAAFRRSALRTREKPYRSGALGPSMAALEPAFAAAAAHEARTEGQARAFFETHFEPRRVRLPTGGPGFVTGFYEPEAEASPRPDAHFRFPLLGPPPDLVEIEDGAIRPEGIEPSFRFARRLADASLAEFPDRRAIEEGALAGQGLELAWLASKVDLFFIHVQGAARLRMPDGSLRRVTYAAKSGHPFTGPGGVLAALGELDPDQVTMQSIRAWLASHPERADDILRRNRSFIFFRDAPVDDPGQGPIAAAKVPLTAGRSMAVDRLLYTFGTPFFVDAPTLDVFDGRPFRRLMIAQDTGSAIVGPARGDLFAGSGDAAGEVAGVVRHPAAFVVLWPRTEPAR